MPFNNAQINLRYSLWESCVIDNLLGINESFVSCPALNIGY